MAISSVVLLFSITVLVVHAQSDLQTTKYRNMVIDLGDGVKTNATLTYPAVGKGPFPGVLLIQGAGPGRPMPELAPYLSERGFAVLQYDKRGTNGVNNTIIDPNIWGNITVNNLIHDAEKALNVLIQLPEVDPKRASIVGHSEGTVIAPRVAIDNSTNVKNIVLMGTMAQNLEKDILYNQAVNLPFLYATQVLDKNHTGFVSIQQMAKDPLPFKFIVPIYAALTNNTKAITDSLFEKFGATDHVSIQKQIRPELIKSYENVTALNISDMTALNTKCNNIVGCPVWMKSHQMLIPNLSIIGNVSKSIGVMLLNGENDSQTTVQQAFLLQQRLTDVNHPDHTLITYPNLGHNFYPSSQWFAGDGPIEPYVLADLYAWLAAHSGLSYPYLAPAFSNMTTTTPSGANETGSSNSNNMTEAT
ncbi:MAG TPA: prolyl oligopeptidase family serine peptidase [Nitrososphaeraceae archaeon]|nr:prolyl oligopeptidase family serine peptidase [Nitrososphaeraceae archaeon]